MPPHSRRPCTLCPPLLPTRCHQNSDASESASNNVLSGICSGIASKRENLKRVAYGVPTSYMVASPSIAPMAARRLVRSAAGRGLGHRASTLLPPWPTFESGLSWGTRLSCLPQGWVDVRPSWQEQGGRGLSRIAGEDVARSRSHSVRLDVVLTITWDGRRERLAEYA